MLLQYLELTPISSSTQPFFEAHDVRRLSLQQVFLQLNFVLEVSSRVWMLMVEEPYETSITYSGRN